MKDKAEGGDLRSRSPDDGYCDSKGGEVPHEKRRDCVNWQPAQPLDARIGAAAEKNVVDAILLAERTAEARGLERAAQMFEQMGREDYPADLAAAHAADIRALASGNAAPAAPPSAVVDAGHGKQEETFHAPLFCPRCFFQHVDDGEWAARPHHTHLCATCHFYWRVEPYTFGIASGEPPARPPSAVPDASQQEGLTRTRAQRDAEYGVQHDPLGDSTEGE